MNTVAFGVVNSPVMDSIAARLSKMLVGRAAASLLSTPGLPRKGSLVVLPNWLWRKPRIDMGRKTLTIGDRARLFPIRVAWDNPTGPLVPLGTAQSAVVAWRAAGLGVSETGEFDVRQRELDETSRAEVLSWRDAKGRRRLLENLVAAGEQAKFEMLAGLEGLTRECVLNAVTSITAEVAAFHGYTQNLVLDEVSREEVTTWMLYGKTDSEDTSVVLRMLERALNPETFVRVDPSRYFVVNVRARAEELVRQKLDDPKVGARVRRVFRTHQPSSVEELVAVYRELYPEDQLGERRAKKALTVAGDVNSDAISFDELFSVAARNPSVEDFVSLAAAA